MCFEALADLVEEHVDLDAILPLDWRQVASDAG